MLVNPREIRELYGDDYNFNSWDHVEGLREVILEGRLRVTNGLEHEWQLISKDDQSPSMNQGKPRDLLQSPTNTPIEALATYLEMGTYPPPEVLLAVADCFTLYYQSHGKIELEEAFFGRVRRKSGNFSARRSRDLLYRFFHTQVAMEGELGDNSNMTVLAEKFLARMNVSDFEVDTFLRGYRRWKSLKLSEKPVTDN
jgi:hypothetical protein